MLMSLIYIQNVGPHSMTAAPGSAADMLRPPVICSGDPEYHLVFLLASTLLDNRAQDDIGCLCTLHMRYVEYIGLVVEIQERR